MSKFSSLSIGFAVVFGTFIPPAFVWGQMNAMKADEQSSAEQTVGFDQVQPILRKRCQTCHNPEELRGDFSVTDLTALEAGSSSGPVMVPGKPRESLLYTTAAHLDEPTMPPNSRKIPARELEVIRRWIEGGMLAKSGDKPSASESQAAASKVADVQIKSASESGDVSNAGEYFEPIRGLLQPTPFSSLAAQSEGKLIAVAGNQQIVLLDLETRALVKAIPFSQQEITKLTFSKNGQLLVAGGGVPGLSGSVYGFDVATGSASFELADENDSILALDLSPDGRLVAFGGPSKTLKICRVTNGEAVHTLRKHTDWVLSAKFSDDGLLVASSDRFGGLFVWDVATGELFHSLKGHSGPVHDITWDSDGETLLSAGEDGQIRVWNLHHGELTAQWDGGVGPILSIDRKGAYTLVGGRNGSVKAWSAPELCSASFEANEQIDCVLIAGSSSSCVAADASGRLHVLKFPNLDLVQVVTLPSKAEARSELVARIERQSAEYDRELQEQQMLASQQPIDQARESAQTAPDASETLDEHPQQIDSATVASSEPEGNSALVAAIEAEIDAVKRILAEKVSTRDRIERQIADLQAYLEAQSRSVENSNLQLERLEKILQLARSPVSASAESPGK